MKQLYNLSTRVVMIAILVSGIAMAQTRKPMSGSFTIDKNSPASSTNFVSFASAISALQSESVNGPVQFEVLNGPYTEQITIPAITGASSKNTITFDGNGETIQFSSTSTTNRHTIQLNGADWIVLDDLDIVSLNSANGRGVWMRNSADNNVIRNCTFRMPNMTSTTNANAYIAMTQGTSTMTSYGDPGENNLIEDNIFQSGTNRGPYTGIAIINESGNNNAHPNVIRNNDIKDFYHSGIFAYYVWGQEILNNEIHNTGSSRTGTKYGIYMYNYQRGGEVTIQRNNIHSLTTATAVTYGMYIYAYNYNGSGSDEYIIEYNRVHRDRGSTTYGIYVYGYSYLASNSTASKRSISYNDIELVGITSTTYGIYDYGYYGNARRFDVIGNKVTIRTTGTPTVYGIYGIYGYPTFNNTEILFANNQLNILTNGFTYALYTSNPYATKTDVVYNTVNSGPIPNGTVTSTKYLYMLYYVNGDFKNNLLNTTDNGGTVYGVYHYGLTTLGGPADMDHNNMFIDNASTITFYNYNGTSTGQYTTFDEYKQNMGGDGCISVDPKFRNPATYDFTPTSFKMVNKGEARKDVTTDINGKARSNTPDIGAVEFDLDVAISGFSLVGADGTNNSYECGDYSEMISVDITNKNNETITGVPIKYTINGVVQETAEITANIGPNAKYTYQFEKPAVFNQPGINEVIVALDGSDDGPNDNEMSDRVNIVSSPSGFAFSEGPAFPGYFRDILGGGTTVNPDATAPDSMMQYELQTPARYNNSDYGTTWEGTAGARTMGGQPVTVSMSRNPSSSGNGLLQFTAPKSLEDSMVYISYTIRDNSTMCDSTIGRWVYVVPTPTASFVANNVCDGTPVEYRSTSAMSKADVVLLYEWDFNDPNSTEDVSEIAEGVYTYETFGTYDIEMIVRHSEYPKFEFKAMKSITVTPVPTVDYKVISACYGEDVTFTNNTSSPVPATITYRWDFGDGTSSTMEEPSKGYSQAGQYQVTLTATANGCSRSVTKNANQFAVPTADFSWEGECVSQPISLMGNNSIAIGNAGYEWVFDNGERRTNAEESFTWSTPGQKTVKLRAISEFNCQDSVEKQITIVDAPVADFEFSDPCNLSDINFTFTGKTVGVPLYSWDFNGESTSDAANPSVRFDEGEKMVKLRLETSQNNCVSEIEKSFRVKLQPEADFAVEDVCEGDEAVFTNMSSVARGEMNFNWKFGTGDQDNSTNPRYAYITNGETETYNVTLVASVTGGCSDSVSKTITVNELPNVNFTVDRRGRTVGLTPSGNTSNYTFKRWTFGDGGSSSEDAPVYTYDNIINGEFEICFSAQSNAGCLNSTCETVIIDVLSTEEMEVSWLKVYPNPSSGQLTLEVEGNQRDLEISVLNQLGEEVYTYQPNVLNGRYAMDLSELASGMYLIRVNNDQQLGVKTIQILR